MWLSFALFINIPQIQHNDFVTLKTKMADEYNYFSETEKEKRIYLVKVDVNTKKVDINIDYSKIASYPNNLFKYYSVNENGFNVLKNGEIYASSPFDFNDPFDSSDLFWRGENFPYHAAKLFLRERLVAEQVEYCVTVNQLRQMFLMTILDFFGIFCLNDGTQEDLFWGYYNDHKGFRVKLNTESLNQYWGTKPLKIEYLNYNELLSQRLSLEEKDLEDFSIFPKIVRWLTVKKDYWQHENEWRYILGTNHNARLIKYPDDAIESITLGYKFFDNISQEYLKRGIYKYKFDQEENAKNWPFEIIKFLIQNETLPIFQVALTPDMKLYNQPIYLKKITEDEIIVEREFSEEQLIALDFGK